MSKSYTLVLDSLKADNKTAGTNAYRYYVNWGSFLPPTPDQYEVSFSFVTGPFFADPSVYLKLSIDFGSTLVYSGNGSSAFVGLLRLGAFTTAGNDVYCYNAEASENVPITVNKPSNDYITVFIKDGDLPENVPDYELIINFKPVA